MDFTFTYYPDMTWSSFGAPAYSSMYITSMDLYTGKTGFLWPKRLLKKREKPGLALCSWPSSAPRQSG